MHKDRKQKSWFCTKIKFCEKLIDEIKVYGYNQVTK
jgi:hypothetical protein